MNKKFLATAASTLMATAVMAQDVIVAKKAAYDVGKLTASSQVWNHVKGTAVILYPQTTIRMNDKKAHMANKVVHAKKATVKALYDGKKIAFLLEWPDGTKSVQKGYQSDVYGDGFAVQFPVHYDHPKTLPYIGMGSEGRPVIIHLKKAVQAVFEPNGDGDVGMQQNVLSKPYFGDAVGKYQDEVAKRAVKNYRRAFISEGFRSMTEIKDGSETFSADMKYTGKGWRGAVTRPLRDIYLNLDNGAFPVAFAAWDGARLNRDGLKLLSSWVPVRLEGKTGGEALIKELTADPKGDIANGKALVEQNGCTGCHYIPGMSMPSFMAPGLANIGGYSTTAYLKESLVDPSAVVVPGYNRNAHPNTPWYSVADGKRQSAMPPYPLDEKSLNDMVAYLKTLKAEVK